MNSTVTVTPSPIKPNVPLWLTGHQCPRIEYNPTSSYKLKIGDKTGYGVVCQYTSRSQKEMNAIYVGGLDDRRPSGYGEWHSEDERMSYHGGWKDNVASGYGRYSDSWTIDWPDSWARFLPGDSDVDAKVTYEGGFKEGLFHGHGELLFRDKSKYEGSWKEGRRWGYGKYTKDDGTVISFGGPKKEEKKEEAKDEKKHERKEPIPQFIYLQQPGQYYPQVMGGPVPIAVTPQPNEHQANAGISFNWGHGGPQQVVAQPQVGQPIVVTQPPHEHQANAGVSVNWGHGNMQQPVQQQTYMVPGAVDIVQRPTTPIPVQYTYGPARPITPIPQHVRQGSQSYFVTVPTPGVPVQAPGPGSPGNPPYPTDGLAQITISNSPPGSLNSSPSNTQFMPHM
jgi:hypothetical protein